MGAPLYHARVSILESGSTSAITDARCTLVCGREGGEGPRSGMQATGSSTRVLSIRSVALGCCGRNCASTTACMCRCDAARRSAASAACHRTADLLIAAALQLCVLHMASAGFSLVRGCATRHTQLCQALRCATTAFCRGDRGSSVESSPLIERRPLRSAARAGAQPDADGE